jgi:histone H3/H4
MKFFIIIVCKKKTIIKLYVYLLFFGGLIMVIISKTGLKKAIKDATNSDYLVSSDSVNLLSDAVEKFVEKVSVDAAQFTKVACRKTIKGDDIKLALKDISELEL